MKFVTSIILIFFNCFFSYTQTESEVIKIEIYARLIEDSRSGGLPINKKDIKKKNQIYVELKDKARIRLSNIEDLIDDLEIAKDQYKHEDYSALVIVHFSNKKKEEYYIASSDAGVYKNNLRYEYSCSFISTIYSFLPIYYYEYGEPFYYKKPCD